MKIVEFYRGERGNHLGVTLDQMMAFSPEDMEMDHDYIQWMFPSNEPSGLNCDAPVLTYEESLIFVNDPELQEKVKQSFVKYLGFLGFVLTKDDETDVTIGLMEPTEKRPDPQLWTREFNHNMLRVTRVLKCLRLTGNNWYAVALFDALRAFDHARQSPTRFSMNTWKFWSVAVKENLWAGKPLSS